MTYLKFLLFLILSIIVSCNYDKTNSANTLELKKYIERLSFQNDLSFPMIIYSVDEYECEQCLISHLKMLSHLSKRTNITITVNYLGDSLPIRFLQYKKVYKLNMRIIQTSLSEFPDLKNIDIYYTFLVYDSNANFVEMWVAEASKIFESQEKIQKFISEFEKQL